jgi:menaquinone-9 beta-reductase
MSAGVEAREEAEIVVVGAGPSGSAAAAVLGELGHEVLLVDKDEFPREKPCGDGLMHPAVAAAQQLGLAGLIEAQPEIEAARIVVAHRRQELTLLTATPGRPQPRCIARAEFDAALLEGARQRGARFLQARVESFEENGRTRLLATGSEGERFEIRAGTVVAADGATSRLRRVVAGSASAPLAYAVRQYFVSGQPLDPVFDFYLPLEIDGAVLSGYGWVFPVGEHLANVGVGFYRDGNGSAPPLTRVLEAFVEELRLKAGRRFGDLREDGEPYGSPVGIRPHIEVSDRESIAFCGDAAGTTHALTGEGIAFAMRGGEAVARELHRRGRNGHRDAAGARKPVLPRLFPQLGVDISMLDRTWTREMSKGASGPSGKAPRPFLAAVKQLLGESAYATGTEATPAWSALASLGTNLAAALERADERLLDELSTPLPFVKEVVYRSIGAHLGPIYAAAAIGSSAGKERQPPEAALDAAVAAECVGVLPELLTMLVDRASSKTLRVNNAFAILAADFAATRAMRAASRLGAAGVAALSLACQRGCDGGMRDSQHRFAPNRPVDDWFQAAQETAGAAAVLATQLGSIAAGVEAAPAAEYGVELGVAIRLAEEIADLTVGPEAHPGKEGADLRRGIYPLPVLYAIEEDPQLPQLLAQHTAEDGRTGELTAAVERSGGIERALEECSRRAGAAAAIAAGLGGDRGEALAALATAPERYLDVRLGGAVRSGGAFEAAGAV